MIRKCWEELNRCGAVDREEKLETNGWPNATEIGKGYCFGFMPGEYQLMTW